MSDSGLLLGSKRKDIILAVTEVLSKYVDTVGHYKEVNKDISYEYKNNLFSLVYIIMVYMGESDSAEFQVDYKSFFLNFS